MAYRPDDVKYFELVYDEGDGLFVLRTAPSNENVRAEYSDFYGL